MKRAFSATLWLALKLTAEFCLGGGLYFLTFHGLRVWDYTGCPHEYRGLICLKFSLCWGALMWLILAIDALIERLLARTPLAFAGIFAKRT